MSTAARFVPSMLACGMIACAGSGAPPQDTDAGDPVAPAALTYAVNPASYFVGQPIVANTPNLGETAAEAFTISPSLPEGLQLDPQTGVISGAPSALAPEAVYRIHATSPRGAADAELRLAVLAPRQVPLSMIGDSITWAPRPYAYEVRNDLLRRIPDLAFVGTHSDEHGHSHSGEGGNGSLQVLHRLAAVPDSPWHHVLVGTNDNSIDAASTRVTADTVLAIVDALLARPATERVFVGELVPDAGDAAHDAGNTMVNVLLAAGLASRPRATLVRYEAAIRAVPSWRAMFAGKHPNEDAQAILAATLAEALLAGPRPTPPPIGRGVRVTNLWASDAAGQTAPLVAGWYTVSLDVKVGADARVRFTGPNGVVGAELPVTDSGRVSFSFFTGFEGYDYGRGAWRLETANCDVSNVLVEKQRPSGRPSAWNEAATFVDVISPISGGELLEPATANGER